MCVCVCICRGAQSAEAREEAFYAANLSNVREQVFFFFYYRANDRLAEWLHYFEGNFSPALRCKMFSFFVFFFYIFFVAKYSVIR